MQSAAKSYQQQSATSTVAASAVTGTLKATTTAAATTTTTTEQHQQKAEKIEKNLYRYNNKTTTVPALNSDKQLQPPNSLVLQQQNTNLKSQTRTITTTVTKSKTNSLEDDNPDARYECAICMNWLNEPVLTSCGHRFCKSCLKAWLCNERYWCPMDNKTLTGDHDIFPDNFTRREIEQIKLKCPNAKLGCELIASPIEVERHRYNCPYRSCDDEAKEMHEEKCPFACIKCDFVGRPETNALEVHLKEDITLHMQLMLNAVQTIAVNTWNPQKQQQQQTNGYDSNAKIKETIVTTNENGVQLLPLPLPLLTPPPPPLFQYTKNEQAAGEQLLQMLYQRIVILEQRACEQAARIETLTKQLTTQQRQQQIDPHYSNGTILWEINHFHKLIEHLRMSANHLEYSRECYTSPYGYKFCARLNIPSKQSHILSLHVHLMQSENDYHLDWPFNGRIKLCMIHPGDIKLSQHDTLMTKPDILAFHQPREHISTRGFGFIEYANINEIIRDGFCENDRLVIKIQINIV